MITNEPTINDEPRKEAETVQELSPEQLEQVVGGATDGYLLIDSINGEGA